MLETIEVRYKEISGSNGVYYHKYIVYTDSDGNKYYARGGPSALSVPVPVIGFGYVDTEYGAYDVNSVDWDDENDDQREIIETQADLSSEWQAIKDAMDYIKEGNYQYSPFGQNSNTAADYALNYAGLPPALYDEWLKSPASDNGFGIFYQPSLIPYANWHRPQTGEPHEGPLLPPHQNLAGWVPRAAGGYGVGPAITSPLILDIDGDGIETTRMGYGVDASNVYFDVDNDGFAERTGWVTGGDGLLAWDKNSNGRIDDQSELFGNSATYADGFAYLDTLDTNSDNKITSADTNWSNLRVWIDADGDGITDSGELQTLTSLNITEISLNSTALTNTYNNENLVSDTSTFVIGGQTRTISDVWFRHDNLNSRYLDDVALVEDVFYLPTLKGYGLLKDIHIAMSEDNDLLDLVKDFVLDWSTEKFGDKTSLDGEIEQILFTWAGVENVNPTSRGTFVDARIYGFLEKFFDKLCPDITSGTSGAVNKANALNSTFDYIVANLGAALISQSGLYEIYDTSPIYNYWNGDFASHGVLSSSALSALSAEATASPDAEDYWIALVSTLIKIKNVGDFTAAETTALNSAIQVSLPSSSWSSILGQSYVEVDYFYNGSSDSPLSDYLVANHISNQIDGSNGNDLMKGLDGNDTLQGQAGDDEIYGGNGNDSLLGGDDNDLMFGEAGSDNVYGGNGSDIIIGGAGTDDLRGDAGNDLYIFDENFGDDQIRDTSGTDEIQFAEGIALEDLRFFRSSGYGNDLQIFLGSDRIYLHSHYSTQAIETLLLSDSTSVNLLGGLTFTGTSSGEGMYGTAYDDVLYGLAGTETITAYAGNDILEGGADGDYLYGGSGNDIYRINAGTGHDTIQDDSGADEIRLGAGLTISDLRFWKAGSSTNDLTIYIGGSSNSLTLRNQFYDLQNSTSSYDEIELLRFSDNSTINLLSGLTFTGTTSSENVYGTKGNDTIVGLGGGDYLEGGLGSDAYVFNLGFGQNTIQDVGGTDKILFGAGITVDDLRFVRPSSTSSELYIYMGSNYIQVRNHFYDLHNGTSSYDEMNTVQFADNSTIDLSGGLTFTGTSSYEDIHGTKANDILIGLGGADTLYGYEGNDVLNGGAGSDYLTGGTGQDTFAFAPDLSAQAIQSQT